jgi:hypothetical protein
VGCASGGGGEDGAGLLEVEAVVAEPAGEVGGAWQPAPPAAPGRPKTQNRDALRGQAQRRAVPGKRPGPHTGSQSTRFSHSRPATAAAPPPHGAPAGPWRRRSSASSVALVGAAAAGSAAGSSCSSSRSAASHAGCCAASHSAASRSRSSAASSGYCLSAAGRSEWIAPFFAKPTHAGRRLDAGLGRVLLRLNQELAPTRGLPPTAPAARPSAPAAQTTRLARSRGRSR